MLQELGLVLVLSLVMVLVHYDNGGRAICVVSPYHTNNTW